MEDNKMTMEDAKRIVEIDGIKIEVDMRNAKRIDTFRVGDNVRVLCKKEQNKIIPGIIVDFANFKELPTIVIAAYKEGSYFTAPEIVFIYLNNLLNEEYEIMLADNDELKVSCAGVIQRFEDDIKKKRDEMQELQKKLDYFKEKFMKCDPSGEDNGEELEKEDQGGQE